MISNRYTSQGPIGSPVSAKIVTLTPFKIVLGI